MEIKEIEKQSIKVFLVCEAFFIILSIALNSISYSLGFLLGYLINLVDFRLIQVEADGILSSVDSKMSIFVVILSFILKLVVYAAGLLIAIHFPSFFNIFSVTFGYFVIKLTIFFLGYRNRKG